MSSGMRWAETTRASCAMPNCSRICTACCMVSQSLLEPMTTPIWMGFMVWRALAGRLRLLCRCRWNPRFYFLRLPSRHGAVSMGQNSAQTPPQAPGLHTGMIDVTVENFETEVVAASMNVPVLVDFWAPWCGPCKSLGPVLEKLETEYAGRFKLAKIDSDQEQQLAAMFGIRSIPTCVLLMNGQPVDGFTGALPEGKVREFLDKHVPSAEEVQAEVEEEQALDALAEGDTDTALEKLQHAVATDPANDDARFDYVKLLLQLGSDDDAKVAFAPVIAKAPGSRKLGALKVWMDALDFVAVGALGADAGAQFDAKIATNKRDFEARFGRARWLM